MHRFDSLELKVALMNKQVPEEVQDPELLKAIVQQALQKYPPIKLAPVKTLYELEDLLFPHLPTAIVLIHALSLMERHTP